MQLAARDVCYGGAQSYNRAMPILPARALAVLAVAAAIAVAAQDERIPIESYDKSVQFFYAYAQALGGK